MKRLTLDAFKTQHQPLTPPKQTDQLLGQVLGDCHDSNGDNTLIFAHEAMTTSL